MACTLFIFWLFLGLLLYTYIGYGVIASIVAFIQSIFRNINELPHLKTELPEVTLIIPAYNEAAILSIKLKNSCSLDYPTQLLKIILITDGSNDSSTTIAKSFPQVEHLHENERGGKMAAINRAMLNVQTPIVVFSDANTLLNNNAIREIVQHYTNPTIGGVAGEKKIMTNLNNNIVGEGEGIYWKYESAMKQLDSNLYTVIAAGELFSLRTSLFKPLPNDTILDDLILAIETCKQGYRIVYEKNAFAIEPPSINLAEEKIRKVRIASGAAQAIIRLGILPSFNNWMLNFQFFSRRIIRWIISPIALPIVFFSNFLLVFYYHQHNWLALVFALQTLFYSMGLLGYMLYKFNKKNVLVFVPYYFVFMNWCMLQGIFKQLFSKQSSVWQKSKRLPFPLEEFEHQ